MSEIADSLPWKDENDDIRLASDSDNNTDDINESQKNILLSETENESILFNLKETKPIIFLTSHSLSNEQGGESSHNIGDYLIDLSESPESIFDRDNDNRDSVSSIGFDTDTISSLGTLQAVTVPKKSKHKYTSDLLLRRRRLLSSRSRARYYQARHCTKSGSKRFGTNYYKRNRAKQNNQDHSVCHYCKCHLDRNRKIMDSSVKVDMPLDGTTEPLGELDGQLAQMATNVGKKFDFKNMNFRAMLHERWRSMKSWGSFFDTGRWAMPTSALQWSRRLLKNLDHFQSNYFCVVFVLIIYCILTSPLLLIAITATIVAMYMIAAKNQETPLKIAGFSPTLYQQYIAIAILSIPLYLLAGAPSMVFWVIGASFFVIGLHASIYAIEMLDTIDDSFMINTQSPTSPVQDL